MNKQPNAKHAALLPSIAASLVALAATIPTSLADGTSTPAGAGNGAALVGGALPGGAVISARYATVMPASGGPAVSTPIAGDGSFAFAGLAPGPYRLTLTTVPKQTQGATFGEKVNAGLHAAGSAVSQGSKTTTTKHDTAMNSVGNIRGREAAPSPAPASEATTTTAETTQKGINGINGGMPNRISMNVTVARQTRMVDVDGAPIDVAVAGDGSLAGRVASAQ